MRMRFRTDGWHYADLKAQGMTWEEYASCFKDSKEWEEAKKWWDQVPKAEPGDVWRVRWSKPDGEGPIAGYAICCISCGQVHTWTTARNCSQKTSDGSCAHSGKSSCWEWTGSAEDGTLSATPSLLVIAEFSKNGCGWHGYITNGDIHP